MRINAQDKYDPAWFRREAEHGVMHHDVDRYGENPLAKGRAVSYLQDNKGNVGVGLITNVLPKGALVIAVIVDTGNVNYDEVFSVPSANVTQSWAW